MTNSNGANLGALFGNAVDDGTLSEDTLNGIDMHDIGADIQAALGVSVDDVTASEVTLVTMLIDDSWSIQSAGNEAAVRTGHNTVLDALTASKQRDGLLSMCRYLNGKVLYAYCPVESAERMDARNYNGNGGTPLYDESVVTLATVLAKHQEFIDSGIACRTVTLIMTDGADAGSHKHRAADVKKIVNDMLRAETHIVAFMGVSDGVTDFEQVARDMGVPDQWILTPGNSASEIRAAFNMFSQSATRASQTAGAFSQANMGGFAAP